MPDPDVRPEGERPGASRPEPALPSAVAATEVYQTDEGVVFYDAEYPLAWIQAASALSLEDMA